MRLVTLLLATALPVSAFADDFTIRSVPTSVVVHPNAALVTREVTFDLPSGTHNVILPDLPPYTEQVRLAADGATVLGSQIDTQALTVLKTEDGPELAAAKENVDQAHAALETLETQIAEQHLIIAAVEAQVGFLRGLPQSQSLPPEPSALRDISEMVSETTLDAQRKATQATQAIHKLERQRDELQQALNAAERARDAFMLPKDRTEATVKLTAAQAGPITLTVTYPTAGAWWPAYDMRLTDSDSASLTIQRAARIEQNSGEHWRDVSMRLSTQALSNNTAPSHLEPPLRTYEEQEPVTQKMLPGVASFAADESARIITEEYHAPTIVEGPVIEYAINGPIEVLNGRGAIRIGLTSVDLAPRVFARAVPLYDETAFMMAQTTNTSKEPILASDDVMLYVDDTLVGITSIGQIPAGEEFDLGFGPIVGLQLNHKVIDRSEGERGFIGRENAEVLQYRMDIENRSDRTWEVELMGAIPYSEQDDLTIAWKADPMPSVTDVKDKRGLLRWDLALEPGEDETITVEHDMRWPDGKILR